MGIDIQGVHHIMITVGDIAVAKKFYESVIGLKEVECPVKDGERVWFKMGGQELHVNLHKEFRAGISHFALSVKPDEYHAYYEQVKSSGYEQVGQSRLYKEDNLHRFYLDDPFGNTIEVIDGQINA